MEWAAALENIELPEVSNYCIYKVPQRIQEINKAAYTPLVISIGPLHHGDERLELMEELKLRYLKSFLQRTEKECNDYIQKLEKQEKDIRDCYAQTILPSKDDFVKMIVIDACFIIEYLCRWRNSEVLMDPILSQPWMREDVERDLLLLENELPFFILEGLYTPTCVNARDSSFLELSFHYFKSRQQLIGQELNFFDFREKYLEGVQVKHFTDLLRIFHLPPPRSWPRREDTITEPKTYNASQLVEAGVEIQSGEVNSVIKFSGSVLTIPSIMVEDRTETELRNIVALEQCHYPYESYVTDYVELLDNLIDSTKDVDILVSKGIMINFLGNSNKVATMVNDLGRGIMINDRGVDYKILYQNLNTFCQKPLHKYKANLKHEYFSTPWRTASSIAAIVLLLLTLIQTICSVISLSLDKGSSYL